MLKKMMIAAGFMMMGACAPADTITGPLQDAGCDDTGNRYAMVVAECESDRLECIKAAETAWVYVECERQASNCYYRNDMPVEGDLYLCLTYRATGLVRDAVNPRMGFMPDVCE